MLNDGKVIDSKGSQEYVILEELGYGSYGRVFKIKLDKINEKSEKESTYLTLKRFFFDKYRSSKSIVEKQTEIINSLKIIDKECNYTPRKFEYVIYDENDSIISDYYEYNLLDLIKKKDLNLNINSLFFKSLIYYLVSSLDFLHSNNILHRDIKPDNIMINSNGEVKFIDFDLMKNIEKNKEPHTKGIYTIYYRPAEILFGDTNYTYKADIWALGCVLAEIYLKSPIFKSENEFYLLDSITNTIGLINEGSFPGVSNLPNFFELDEPETVNFDKLFSECDEDYKNLISLCLNLNPEKRKSCKELLNHKYFDDIKKDFDTYKDNIDLILKKCKESICKTIF